MINTSATPEHIEGNDAITALGRIAAPNPSRLNAAASVVLLGSAQGMTILAHENVLNRLTRTPNEAPRGMLPTSEYFEPTKDFSFNGEPIERGRVYVAPPDRHIEIRGETIALTSGPREHRVRPSVDVLFRSAAACRGERVIGVVLSGALSDGAAGLADIRAAGGVTIVQDPSEAQTPSMPLAAIERTPVQFVLPAGEIGVRR